MKRNVFFFIAFAFLWTGSFGKDVSQNKVTGNFPNLAGQQISLVGFNGLDTYAIDKAQACDKGRFELSFDKNDYGMGYLEDEDGEAFIVILAPSERLILEGEVLAIAETVEITSGKQNQLFEKYAAEHLRREQALGAWLFLDRIYQQDSLFAVHEKPATMIEQEMKRIKEEDKDFLEGLDHQMYISWFLPVRKLVSSISTIAQYRTEEIPEAITAFREMDYTDPRLWKSGLLRETIENHFWLIENSGRPLDSVYVEMNISIDHMIENLASDEKKFNEIIGYLFNLLEQRSLFGASEYLALKVLNEVSCIIDDNLARQLESYRAMKVGNIAPNFDFPEHVIVPGDHSEQMPQKLSDINGSYTLVVFGAGGCTASHNELMQIAGLYERWRQHGVDVVYVCLDKDKEGFEKFVDGFPFISICDYKKWDSPIAKAYHVFTTPMMYLLDSDREVLLRPNSARHMNAWVDWYLVQGKRKKNNSL